MTAPYVFRRPFDPKVFGRRHGSRDFTRPVYTKTATGLLSVNAAELGTNRATARPQSTISANASVAVVFGPLSTSAAGSIGARAGLSGVNGLFALIAGTLRMNATFFSFGQAIYHFNSTLGLRAGQSASGRIAAIAATIVSAKAGIGAQGGFFYSMAATMGAKLAVSASARRTAVVNVPIGAKAGLSGAARQVFTVSVVFGARATLIPSTHSTEYAIGMLAANSIAGIFARRTEKAGNDQNIALTAAMAATAIVIARVMGTVGVRDGMTASAKVTRVASALIGARAGQVSTSVVTLRPAGLLSAVNGFSAIIFQRSLSASTLGSKVAVAATPRAIARGAALIAGIAGLSAAATKTNRAAAVLSSRATVSASSRTARAASGTLGAILREQQPVAMSGMVRALVGISASSRITRAVARATLSELSRVASIGGSQLRPTVTLSTKLSIPSVTVSVVYHTEALPGFTLTNAIARFRVLSNDLTRFGGVQFTRQD